jgi:acetyl-CoA carboxylase biotin carboxylase subunit
MFSKILIANRGEIALRIARSCRELGIKTVAVYSEADRASLHLKLADESVCIGPPDSRKSYLNAENIFKAAHETGAEAIHPGYGYLAESHTFALACLDQGFGFIGPTPQNLKIAGDKIVAREMMENAGVPAIPGSSGPVGSIGEARIESERIGYPVMLKSAGGGGGRGIRVCENADALAEEFPIAGMEARASFGNGELYVEKHVADPRHIEFQILADRDGNTIHLGERECTIQRRFQKLIEESPSPFLTSRLREQMGNAAVTAARAIHYFNAGTVEFLVDGNENFYFMEMNARIQVEHPITELTTGLDLVKEQIRLASGQLLHVPLSPLEARGWAIECRINAEDPERNFAPCPGTIKEYHPPGGFGVRLDTHLYQGYELPIYYDSLLAKLIAHDRTREGAIKIMKRALEEFRIGPVKTTIPLHLKIMDDPDFQAGNFHTGFIKKIVPEEEEEDEH